jgi:hypothetical protein
MTPSRFISGGVSFIMSSSGGGGDRDASTICSRAGIGGVSGLARRFFDDGGDMSMIFSCSATAGNDISPLPGAGGVSRSRRSIVPTISPVLTRTLPPRPNTSSGGRGARTRTIHRTQHTMTASGRTHLPARRAAVNPRELAMAPRAS